MHPKLEDHGVTEEMLENMGIGALLSVPCPDCSADILYRLRNEYYIDWKEGNRPAMLLYCKACEAYKVEADPMQGELLHENKGMPEKRSHIPLVERL